MSGYTPQVGDRVKRNFWHEGYIDVDYVGSLYMIGRNSKGREVSWSCDGPWVKVKKPISLPDRWINVYPNGCTGWSETRQRADERNSPARLAVIHIWTDATGDHTELERINP